MTRNDPTADTNEEQAPIVATAGADSYKWRNRRNDKGRWNVYTSDAGALWVGMPKAWAERAVRLINEQPTYAGQMAECQRIGEALRSARAA